MEEESDRLSRIILNSVSQEFETPLQLIESAAAKMISGHSAEGGVQLKAVGESIEVNAKRLRRLVDHLLEMSRLEAGELRLKKHPTDLRGLISKTIQKLELDLQNHKVRLQMFQNVPEITIDPSAIEQVFTNIIDNFVVHTPEGSWLEIESFTDGRQIVIVFRDNGPGLPAEDPEAVFGKFFRGTGQGLGGSGLGLSIAKGLVEAHGGTMSARNRKGGGGEFSIRLPLDRP
jgi:two-component system sensor histidine kinase KdpD